MVVYSCLALRSTKGIIKQTLIVQYRSPSMLLPAGRAILRDAEDAVSQAETEPPEAHQPKLDSLDHTREHVQGTDELPSTTEAEGAVAATGAAPVLPMFPATNGLGGNDRRSSKNFEALQNEVHRKRSVGMT